MGIFGKKKVRTIDFTRLPNLNAQQSNNVNTASDVVDLRNTSNQSTASPVSGGATDFLNTMASNTSTSSASSSSIESTHGILTQVSEISELRTNMRKLTGKLEDSENQVYRLTQRIELLEKKIERFENRGA